MKKQNREIHDEKLEFDEASSSSGSSSSDGGEEVEEEEDYPNSRQLQQEAGVKSG